MIKIGGQKSLQPKIETFPSYGFKSGSGDWLVNVFGHVFQTPPLNLRQKMLLKMLGNMMKASDTELQSSTFKNRVGPFFVEPLWRQQIQLQIGGKDFVLRKKSRRNGQFNHWILLENSLVQQFAERNGENLTLNFSVSTTHPATNSVNCGIELLESEGLSVVSDIDDTIKDSNVRDRRELLMNTFVRDYRCVDGMSAVYQKWCESGVDFHYVSSSPWQLLGSLQKMKSDNQFPDGSNAFAQLSVARSIFEEVDVPAERQGHRDQKVDQESAPSQVHIGR